MNLNEFFDLVEREPIKVPPKIGRTRRLMSEPPCPHCGNKSAWRCDCELGEAG